MKNEAPGLTAQQPGLAWLEPPPVPPARSTSAPPPPSSTPAPASSPAAVKEPVPTAPTGNTNPAPPAEPAPAAIPAPAPAANGSGPDLAQAAAEYADLTQRKRDLERQLAFVKEELTRRESLLAEDLDQAGLQQLKTRAGAVLYRHEALFASLAKDPSGETDPALEALRQQGLGWMVKATVNANTLRSWVKEQEQTPEGLPAELRPHIKISRLPRVGVRLS